MVGLCFAFARELSHDPLVVRATYAETAVNDAVVQGVEAHGDDFRLAVEQDTPGAGDEVAHSGTDRGSSDGAAPAAGRVREPLVGSGAVDIRGGDPDDCTRERRQARRPPGVPGGRRPRLGGARPAYRPLRRGRPDAAPGDLGRPADAAGDGARRLRRPARRGQADRGPRHAATTPTGGSSSWSSASGSPASCRAALQLRKDDAELDAALDRHRGRARGAPRARGLQPARGRAPAGSSRAGRR